MDGELGDAAMIVIRCDANPTLGMGHLMRCRALASALVDEGQRCLLLGPARDYEMPGDDSIFRDWIPMPFASPPAADAAAFVELLAAHSAKAAVVDDYRVDEAYQNVLRAAGVTWLQFNDGPRLPLWADLALNPSPEAEATTYEKVVRNPDTRLLLGPAYAMLRHEFTSPTVPLPPRTPRKVLVTFGGGDDRGGVLTTLQTLLPALPGNVQFLVISGRHNPRNVAIAEWTAAHDDGRIQFHVGPTSVAPLISSCSIAIMAGGGTTYEVNFCGLPMLLIAIAGNQVAHSAAWHKAGAANYLGRLESLEPRALVAAAQLALEQQEDASTGIGTKRLVDGHGRTRVARAMVERLAA